MELNKKKALIVDDEIDLARVLALALQQSGLNTEIVHSIDNAIDIINQTKFDIIVSDIYLPHKTGKDLFEYVISNKIKTPFIFMTGNPDIQMAVDFMQQGGYDYIVKPFNINDFLEKVDTVLHKYEEDIKKEKYVHHLRDVLDLRMQELKLYKDVYQSMNDVILITETSGKIVSANDVVEKLTGYSQNSIIDKTPEIFFDEKLGSNVFSRIMEEVGSKGKWEGDLTSQTKNGEKWDAIINVISIKDEKDETFAYGWQMKDITELRHTQAQMLEFFDNMSQAQEAIIFGLAKLAEYRDVETGYHLERMRAYARLLAERLQEIPRFQNEVDEQFITNLFKTAPLHDIGKVGISDKILQKPGKLTVEEFEIIKQHTIIGYQTLKSIKTQYGEMDFLNMGLDITYYHHEKWDGTGYPKGLCGEEIPLAARITAYADVYDALTSKRVYKDEYTHLEAVKTMEQFKGTHFDPNIFNIFIRYTDDFLNIMNEYKDLERDLD